MIQFAQVYLGNSSAASVVTQYVLRNSYRRSYLMSSAFVKLLSLIIAYYRDFV